MLVDTFLFLVKTDKIEPIAGLEFKDIAVVVGAASNGNAVWSCTIECDHADEDFLSQSLNIGPVGGQLTTTCATVIRAMELISDVALEQWCEKVQCVVVSRREDVEGMSGVLKVAACMRAVLCTF